MLGFLTDISEQERSDIVSRALKRVFAITLPPARSRSWKKSFNKSPSRRIAA